MRKVSIIIPAYRCAEFIEETLQCVLRQTHQNWEVVLVEDGVRDGTEEIVARISSMHPGKFLFLRHATNQGVGPSRNTAMREASGDTLAFLDADDRWEPTYLETMLRAFEQKQADIVYSSVQFFDHATNERLIVWGPTPEDIESFPNGLFARNFIAPSGAIIRREAAARVGEFDTNPLVQSCEDHDYWLRCVGQGLRFHWVPEILSWYRKNHGGQATDNYARILERDIRVLKKNRLLACFPKSVKRNALVAHYRRLSSEKRKKDFWGSLYCYFRSWQLRLLG